jgi:tetratricopeptide (TPR) repeat protein
MKFYRQAVNADPSYFEAAYNLGLLAYQHKDLPLALAANEQAVALKPSSTDARYNFALTLREAHYPIDAANELRELLNTAPNEARAHLALANLYAQQLDEHALARSHYQRFLDLAPNHADASAVRQWLVVHP